MSISDFYKDVLGAELKNVRWSWGAVDGKANRVFLRVWEDQIKHQKRNEERVVVGYGRKRRMSNGRRERYAHLDQIGKGAQAFGVVCLAADPNTNGPRRIVAFNKQTLLKLGPLIDENGRTYARIDARIPVDSVRWPGTAANTLVDDIKQVTGQNIDSTTKEALVNARVGQGVFRAQVLGLWGHRCSVTGSTTLYAIRASHIKPWRESTNEERLDPQNGLPLVANLDALFDAGLISFASSGRLIVSSKVSKTERRIFGILNRSLAKKPSSKMAEYLTLHHDRVFKC